MLQIFKVWHENLILWNENLSHLELLLQKWMKMERTKLQKLLLIAIKGFIIASDYDLISVKPWRLNKYTSFDTIGARIGP